MSHEAADSNQKVEVGAFYFNYNWMFCKSDYYGAAEPPVRCGEVLPHILVFIH